MNDPIRKTRAAAMLVFTAIAWGAMFAVGKSALGVLDAFWLSAVRYAPAAVLMLAVLGVVEGRRALSTGGAALRLLIFGSLGFAGFSILAFLGVAQSRPEHAAIIVALMPLITAMVNWVVRGKRPARLTLGATAVALAGVVLVLTRGDLHRLAGGALHADALVLAGVVCWVGYTMGAAALPDFSTLRYTALSMTFGAMTIIAVTALATAAGIAHTPAWAVIESIPLEIAYMALVAGVLAVLAWNAGISVLGPANGVLFINLVPITAFVISVAQGHALGIGEIAGVALVIGALVVNNVATRAPQAVLRPPAATAAAPLRRVA